PQKPGFFENMWVTRSIFVKKPGFFGWVRKSWLSNKICRGWFSDRSCHPPTILINPPHSTSDRLLKAVLLRLSTVRRSLP
ncbi:MAG: hypothetical protein WBL95_02375, partial [Microcoleus sp.]